MELSGLTEEQRKIALEGLPTLESDSEQVKVQLTESRAFKKAVDKLKELAKESSQSEYGPWAAQFADALTVSAGDDDDEDSEPGIFDYISHMINLPWKVRTSFYFFSLYSSPLQSSQKTTHETTREIQFLSEKKQSI